jgi:hypothetical protein
MNSFLLLCAMGFGFGYDGCEDQKHYFQVITPSKDYGFVVGKDGFYCDVVYLKNSNLK